MEQESEKKGKSENYRDLQWKLEEYSQQDYVPMHMPGAKRNTALFSMGNPYGLDITEIDGFDNLHHPREILADSMNLAAQLFHAEETLYLINGSSAGILAAICGATSHGDTVIVARNCHVSVYNALYMNRLNPIYLQPQCDGNTGIYSGVTLEEVKMCVEQAEKPEKSKLSKQLGNPEQSKLSKESEGTVKSEKFKHPVKAVILTSPTYEGNVSQIKEIADYLHGLGILLIVDEAHGAHFQMSEAFPESAVKAGADAVIQSIHKTLPAFTQTALLHLNGRLINRRKVKMYWNLYQTTSPSYILMAGIDRCMSILQHEGQQLFSDYVQRLAKLRNTLSHLKCIQLAESDDISKLVLVVPEGISGHDLYDWLLKDYHIQLEMASLRYVIAMTSIGDRQSYYDRFVTALREIDARLEVDARKDSKVRKVNKSNKHNQTNEQNTANEVNKPPLITGVLGNIDIAMNMGDAVEYLYQGNGGNAVGSDMVGGELVSIEASVGRISGAQICMYPPGIPLLNPGERITKEVVELLTRGIDTGLEVMGLEEGRIVCLK